MTGEPQSFWRCDADGETYLAATTVVATDPEGNEVSASEIDLVIGSLPCPICGGPMRRVVSLLDARDWSAQFS